MKPKSIKKIKETVGYPSAKDPQDTLGTVPVQVKEAIEKAKMKCNAPRADSHNGKSHVVKACFDGKEKIIRFGQAGVKGSPDGSSRNKRFKARHKKNIAKGPKSAAYWANKVKW
jgi:hypothetical protein